MPEPQPTPSLPPGQVPERDEPPTMPSSPYEPEADGQLDPDQRAADEYDMATAAEETRPRDDDPRGRLTGLDVLAASMADDAPPAGEVPAADLEAPVIQVREPGPENISVEMRWLDDGRLDVEYDHERVTEAARVFFDAVRRTFVQPDISPRVAKNTNCERDGRLEAEATIARVRELALMGGQDPADIRRQIIAVVGVTRYECGVCGGGVRCSCSADGTDGGNHE